ncbi:UNVERIFIED_CONTAM: hypothetical protein NY603_35300, partial [Bacteroidetes bacterium 56_B9]
TTVVSVRHAAALAVCSLVILLRCSSDRTFCMQGLQGVTVPCISHRRKALPALRAVENNLADLL